MTTAENTRRNMEKHHIPTGTDDPLLLALGASPLTTWRSLTFGDLVPGDVVRLDEELDPETVDGVNDSPQAPETHIHFTTAEGWVRVRRKSEPVLVRFPRPEVEA